MDEEQFVCQDCGHHEYEKTDEGDGQYDYECLNCYHIQYSLSGEREEE